MKSKDQQLLEEAYTRIQLNEGIVEEFLKPLFSKIALTLKEKAPEAFAKLASAKTPEDLLSLVHATKTHQNEGVVDAVNKVKEAASQFFKLMSNPATGTFVTGAALQIIGTIILAAAPCVAGGVSAIAGLVLLVVAAPAAATAAQNN